MKVLIACEYSGTVRDAFIRQGHDAISCDLLPTESPGPHYQGDVFDIVNDGFDLMIGHPPCTYLTVTANKWIKDQPKRKSGVLVGKERRGARDEAIKFFLRLCDAPIWKIAIENPIGIMSTVYRKPDQIIQPYYFGNEAQKSTCLWLKNLPLLQHLKESDWFGEKTHVDQGEILYLKSGRTMPKWYANATAHIRSKTFPGIAEAMAEQWGQQ